MSNPAAPQVPPQADEAGRSPGQITPDRDGTEGYGPDVPRLRPEDEARNRDTPSNSESGTVHVGDDDFVAEESTS